MERDLSAQSEQLLQRIFCDKLSESDRNLLQNWLTSRLTIERCGWKKKLQDTLKMVDQERKTNLEAHAFISKLHEEMKGYIADNDLTEKYKSENGYTGPLEEIPDLRSYRLKAIYKMWKTISQNANNQPGKVINGTADDKCDPENMTDVTISIEAPDGILSGEPTSPNNAAETQALKPNNCNNNRFRRSTISDSANMSLQLKIEKLKNENKQLKNYIENVSKNYQNLFFKYSQVVGETNASFVSDTLSAPNPGTGEAVNKQKQFATREKETLGKSLDIPSSGKELRNLVLERNFTISELEKTNRDEKSFENKVLEKKEVREADLKRVVHQQSSESSYSNSSKDNDHKLEISSVPKCLTKFQKSIDLSSESENEYEERRGRCETNDCICPRPNEKNHNRSAVPKQTTHNPEPKNIKDFLKIACTSKPIVPRDTNLLCAARELTQNLTVKNKNKPIDNNVVSKNDKLKLKKRAKNKKDKVKNK